VLGGHKYHESRSQQHLDGSTWGNLGDEPDYGIIQHIQEHNRCGSEEQGGLGISRKFLSESWSDPAGSSNVEIAILADPLNAWALIQALARYPEAQEAWSDTILLDPGNGWG
jgi:hypothetical protein